MLPRRLVPPPLGLAVPALLLLTPTGCYFAALGAGQARVALGQRPLAEVLADPATSAPARRALELVADVRRFGVEELGLEAGTSYATLYDTGGRPVMFALTAARADRLEPVTWWFPVAGRVAYRGYFSAEDARRERDYFARLGYDTFLTPVAAYSTLGWFRDPILSTMLDDPPESLAELVLHEMTHATVYAPGDTDFNEQMASAVGYAGAELYFIRREGADGPHVRALRARRADARRFARLLHEAKGMLEAFYRVRRPPDAVRREREAVFAAIQARFQDLAPSFETRDYDGFPGLRLNNAVILAFARYHDVEDDFARAVRAVGGDLRRLLALGRTLAASGRPREGLKAWLEETGGRLGGAREENRKHDGTTAGAEPEGDGEEERRDERGQP